MSATTVSVPPPATPALTQALPHIASGLSLIFSLALALFRALFNTSVFVVTFAIIPIQRLSPIPFLLFLAAPLIVFAQVLLDIFAYLPYRLLVYVSDAVYPAYVFVGVACITGAMMGLIGRMAVSSILYILPPAPTTTRLR